MQSNFVQIEQQPSVAIKGCSYIYAPAGQAGEYAPLAANPYRGCGHGCAYCYVPRVVKMTREKFDAGALPRRNYLHNLRMDAQKYQAAGIQEQVMLSFTTDVYSPFDMSLSRPSEPSMAVGSGCTWLATPETPSRLSKCSPLTRYAESFKASEISVLRYGKSRKHR
jgi:hypothetical protein